MKKLTLDENRFARPVASPLVEAVVDLLRDRVRTNQGAVSISDVIESGQHPFGLLSPADIQSVEDKILASGYRFSWSASVSVAERPEIYQQDENASEEFCFEHPEAVIAEQDATGREQRGVGDNVVRFTQNVRGIARYIRTNERVLDYLTKGVPENTIAVIDDSGGTLTAPILEYFKGVICAGGTVRSHLGILSREYGIACVMNAKVSGIKDGDIVEIEATAEAKTAEDYQERIERVAKIWRIHEEKNDG